MQPIIHNVANFRTKYISEKWERISWGFFFKLCTSEIQLSEDYAGVSADKNGYVQPYYVIQSKSPSIIEALDVEYEDVSKDLDRIHEMYKLKNEFHQANQKLITAKTDYIKDLLKVS